MHNQMHKHTHTAPVTAAGLRHITRQVNALPGQIVGTLCLTQVVVRPLQGTPAPVCANCELALARFDLTPLAVAV